MNKSRLLGAVCALFIVMLTPLMATATVVDIQRVSDTVGIITGTGTTTSSSSNLILDGLVTSTGDSGVDPFTGDLTLGGIGVNSVFTLLGTTNFRINFNSLATAGSSLNGSLTVTLDAETWSPVGTTGSLASGQGTWQISPVPIPAAIWLFGSGLLGLIGISRKKKAA